MTTSSSADAVRIAEEQAALRRVATLVASGLPPGDLFETVTAEAGLLLGADLAGMIRFEPDGESISAVATWAATGEHPDVSGRWPLAGDRLAPTIAVTRRPVREDAWEELDGPIARVVRDRLGLRSSVGSPIVVEGRVWGALFVHSTHDEPLPADTESRLGDFTELVVTALANAQARTELQALADEQAALRRMATLVASQPSPAEALTTIAREVGTLLQVDGAVVLRYETDATATVLAGWGEPDMAGYVDTRLPFAGDNPAAHVFETWGPARQEDWSGARGPMAEMSRDAGIVCSVAAPIIVHGRLWGTIVVVTLDAASLPPDTETRIGLFTELVATAIGNVEARAELTESRARIVRTSDATRRRFERDLHDGVQQRLVSLALDLRRVETMLPDDLGAPREELAGITRGLGDVLDDLRELSRGLHPAVLSDSGLVPAVRALARRSRIPVALDLDLDRRLAGPSEVGAYYVISEALTNTVKHASASRLDVRVTDRGDVLEVAIGDDGVGGADPARGSGLIGLTDRVEALGGMLAVASPPGGGTHLRMEIPLSPAGPTG